MPLHSLAIPTLGFHTRSLNYHPAGWESFEAGAALSDQLHWVSEAGNSCHRSDPIVFGLSGRRVRAAPLRHRRTFGVDGTVAAGRVLVRPVAVLFDDQEKALEPSPGQSRPIGKHPGPEEK